MEDTAIVYFPNERTVGQIAGKEETLLSVDMPRERFVGLVEELIEKYRTSYHWGGEPSWTPDEIEGLREAVLPVAQTMPRFPFGAWLTERGCGCVVGEYLVAQSEMDRADYTRWYRRECPTIEELLDENPLRSILTAFGADIDIAIRSDVHTHTQYPLGQRLDRITSVEIIDPTSDKEE